jgi:hypothetical protein
MSDTKLAYIAGILDGEGFIGAKRRMPTVNNKMKSPKYSACISVAMTDYEPIHFIADYFGLADLIQTRKRGNYSTIYVLDVENNRAIEILKKALPFLVGKKKQAEAAIRLNLLRHESREHHTKVISTAIFKSGNAQGHPYRVYGLSDEFLKRCDDIFIELHNMNGGKRKCI